MFRSKGLCIINALTNEKTKTKAEYALEMYKTKVISHGDLSTFCEGLLEVTRRGVGVCKLDKLEQESKRDYEQKVFDFLSAYPISASAYIEGIEGTINSSWGRDYDINVDNQTIFEHMFIVIMERIERYKGMKMYVRVKPEITVNGNKKQSYFRLQFADRELLPV